MAWHDFITNIVRWVVELDWFAKLCLGLTILVFWLMFMQNKIEQSFLKKQKP